MSLKDFKKSINKEMGKGTLVSGDEIEDVKSLCSFGSLALDTIIGIGGIPKGRILEYAGPPSGGKTTLALLSAAEVQKAGGAVGFLDVENAFDPKWYRSLGGDTSDDNFLLSKPTSGEEAYKLMDKMIESNEFDLIIVDSVAAMLTEAETEGEFGQSHMAVLARLMSASLKKINASMIENDRGSIIFINQQRSSMNQYQGDVSSGGKGLPYYSSIRLQVTRIGGADGIIGPKEEPEGFRTRIKVIKNKIGPPNRVVETSLYIGPNKFGIDINEEIFDVAIGIGLIKRCTKNKETEKLEESPNGSHYVYEENQFYGLPKFKRFIEENPELISTLKNQVTVFLNKKCEPEEDSFAAEVKKEEKKSTTRKARK